MVSKSNKKGLKYYIKFTFRFPNNPSLKISIKFLLFEKLHSKQQTLQELGNNTIILMLFYYFASVFLWFLSQPI